MRRMNKGLSLLLAVLTVLSMFGAVGFGAFSAAAAAWNGTNYGGGTVYGDKTFLQAFGIDYTQYMTWLDTHDADSSNSKYYLGTPYVGYVAANGTEDHRVPNGDSWYNLPSNNRGAYPPGGHGMQCTGFLWHVLYKSQLASGNGSRLSEIPALSNNVATWQNRGIYRIHFAGSSAITQALQSGMLEKGDIIWVEGSDEWHTGIFYGESSSDNKFWNSAPDTRTNEISKIKGCGSVLNVYVLKVTQPDYVELKVQLTPVNSSLNNDGNHSFFAAKYCVFTSKSEAQAAAARPTTDSSVWGKRIGTIVTNKSGYGALRTGLAPTADELGTFTSSPKYNHEYFSRSCVRSDAKLTYYAVQWSAPKGYQTHRTVYTFTDKGADGKPHRSSTGWRYWFVLPLQYPAPATTEPAPTIAPITTPTEFIEPTEVTEPVETTEPTEPTEPAETTEPVEVTEPAETTEPVEVTEPVETTEPTEPTEPAETTEPVEVTESVETTESVEVTEPVETTEPTVVTEPTEPDEPEPLPGDANLDGTVDITDATTVQKMIAGLLVLEGTALQNADFNGDGLIDITDATAIQKAIAGIPSDAPADSGTPTGGETPDPDLPEESPTPVPNDDENP